MIPLVRLLLCLAPLSLGFAPTMVRAQAPVILGTVVDSATGQPIHGVTLEAEAPDGTVAARASTDQSGRFRLVVATNTAYILRAVRLPYQPVLLDGIMAGQEALTIRMVEILRLPVLDVISVSRTNESTLNAPASVSVVSRSAIADHVSSTATDPLIEVPGVNFARKGVIATSFNPRGSISVFNGGTQFLTDYRYSRAPSLGTSNSSLLPLTSEDIERIEVIRGPTAALYGPNTAQGLVHIITRSPFESEGTLFAVAGGERGYAQTTVRHAQRVSNRVAFKISGEYLRADDWPFVDTASVANPAELGLFKAERILGEGRLDWKPDSATTVMLSGGLSSTTGVEPIAELGRVKVDDWRFGYLQGRMEHGAFFANVMYNTSDAGNTLQLREGEIFVDRSKLYAIQLQHGTTLANTDLIYGIDARRTEPVTDGTIHGQFEDFDTQSEYGAYLHATRELSPFVRISAAIRTDYHDRLSDDNFVLSPRVALILKPNPNHAIRFTFNRAFDSPTPVDLFLDRVVGIVGGLYDVRAFGSPPGGLSFQRDCGPFLGGLCMRSPFTPAGLGGENRYLPSDATLVWRGICPLALPQAVCNTIPVPTAAEVGSVLRVFDPNTGTFAAVNPAEVLNAPARERQITTAFEVGYKGFINNRVWVTVDVYRNEINNAVGRQVIATPSVFFDRASLEAYLTPFIGPANAAAAAAGISGFAGDPDNPGLPIGTVSPQQIADASLLALDLQENLTNTRWGADFGFNARATDWLELSGGYSWVTMDGGLTANFPPHKGMLGARYRNLGSALSLGFRGRYVDSFWMNQGMLGRERIESYVVVDLNATYDFPGSGRRFRLVLDAYNIFDNEHQEIIASPEIGRMIVSRLEVRL